MKWCASPVSLRSTAAAVTPSRDPTGGANNAHGAGAASSSWCAIDVGNRVSVNDVIKFDRSSTANLSVHLAIATHRLQCFLALDLIEKDY